jgi:hypothetical protein
MLASKNGGPIAVSEDSGKKLKPRDALYRFRFVAPVDKQRKSGLIQPLPGQLIIRAEGTSTVGGLFRSIARIWRRESSLG